MTPATSRAAVAAAATAAALLAAGCGSTPPHSRGSGAPVSVPASSLNTSVVTAAGTWATVVMGGSAAQHNNFWQLFIRPAGSTRWRLVTPAGTADNGGLVLAAGGPETVTAFRPSQDLTYTPLTQTSDGGQAWSALSPLDAPLAGTPSALAIPPSGSGLLALLTGGTAETAATGSATWKTLATERTLAATPAGRSCGLQALTAATYTPSGLPLLAGTCSRPGAAGIFADTGGRWRPTGPGMPAAPARRHVTVLRLITSVNQVVALLETGTGPSASLLAAWSADNGGHWTLSPALAVHRASLASASFGPAGTVAVMTTGGRADVITSTDKSWHALPALPAGTATLALGTSGRVDALAVHGSTLIISELPPVGTTWTKLQQINVPIQYGSSS
jgi:hypothetical protein